jgi:DCN1-like protein 1/2
MTRYFSAPPSSSSQSSLNKLFDKYREDAADSPDHVGVDGTMKYLADIGVDIEGLESLAALEIVQAPVMGEMAREGFLKGWSALGYVTMFQSRTPWM